MQEWVHYIYSSYCFVTSEDSFDGETWHTDPEIDERKNFLFAASKQPHIGVAAEAG